MRLLSLASVALIACSNNDPGTAALPTPTPTSKFISPGPGCRLPDRQETPSWVPAEVTLPPGSYFDHSLRPKGGLHRGRFVLRIDTTEFRSYVRSRWPKAGIFLARQDSEPGEVESLFTTSRGTGLFKANDVICDPPYTTLLLIYGR